MVAGDDHDVCVRDVFEKSADLVELAAQGRAVEEVSGDEEQLRAPAGILCYLRKCVPQGFFPLQAPRPSGVRLRAEMYIGSMKKDHRGCLLFINQCGVSLL